MQVTVASSNKLTEALYIDSSTEHKTLLAGLNTVLYLTYKLQQFRKRLNQLRLFQLQALRSI